MSPATKLIAAALFAAVVSASCVFGGGDDEAEATATPAPTESEEDTANNGDGTAPDDDGADGDGDADATPEPDNGTGNGPQTYTVQPGDRLSDIAEQFGVTVDALVEANDIADPNLIYPGEELVIPTGEEDGETP